MIWLAAAAAGTLGAQATTAPNQQQTPEQQATPAPETPPPAVRANYVLGPNDQILIRVAEAEELNNKTFRVDNDGNISLPLVGTLRAAGLSLEQFEAELTKALKVYVRTPQVTISVVQYRAEPVFLVGPFQKPGIYPLQGGQAKLVDLLTLVGGLQPNTSRRIRITRRFDQGKIPLPNASEDPETKTSIVEISLNRLMETANPAENITLLPNDVIRAFKAEMIFISFEGAKSGGFQLDDRDSLSVTQLISMAGGLGAGVDTDNARVLRPILDTAKRAEIPLNVTRILAGKANDFPLLPNDLLVIPQKKPSKVGRTLRQGMTYGLPIVTSLVIYTIVRR